MDEYNSCISFCETNKLGLSDYNYVDLAARVFDFWKKGYVFDVDKEESRLRKVLEDRMKLDYDII